MDSNKQLDGSAAPISPTPTGKQQGSGVQTGDPRLDALLQIMLRREARLAQEEDAKDQARINRAKQRENNAASNYKDDKQKQASCRHLKGGKNRLRTQVKDYAVYMHTFINGERVVRCQLCNAKWKSRDTKEVLLRYGKEVPNHTGIGWDGALAMLAETSNKPSSSEIPMDATPRAEREPTLIEN